MGLAKHPHHPPHRRRRPHQPHLQETTSRSPRLTKIKPPQTSAPPAPLPDRSPGKLTPSTASSQLRALAAQSHLLRRRRLPSLDPLDRAALGIARRQWAPRRALGGHGRGYAAREEEREHSCARTCARRRRAQRHLRPRRHPRASQTAAREEQNAPRSASDLHSVLFCHPSLWRQHARLPFALLPKRFPPHLSRHTPPRHRAQTHHQERQHALTPPNNRHMPHLLDSPTVANPSPRTQPPHARRKRSASALQTATDP